MYHLPASLVVGVTRFELVTSSVSGKRSPPELNARMSCAAQATKRSIGNLFSNCKNFFRKNWQGHMKGMAAFLYLNISTCILG